MGRKQSETRIPKAPFGGGGRDMSRLRSAHGSDQNINRDDTWKIRVQMQMNERQNRTE